MKMIVMTLRLSSCLTGALGLDERSPADVCEPALSASIESAKNTVASMRVDAMPELRGELGLIDEACRRGREVEAAYRLEHVQAGIAATGKPKAAPLKARGACAGSRAAACGRRHATLLFAAACSSTAVACTGRRTMNVDPTPSRLSAATSP